MAACVVEIGLELSKLILHVPSCGALLWPTLSYVWRKKTSPASLEGPIKITLGFFLNTNWLQQAV